MLHIFDCDGTLIDSNGVWKIADMVYADRYNIPLTEHDLSYIPSLIYDDLYTFFTERGLKEEYSKFRPELDSIAREQYENDVELKGGAAVYLEYLAGKGERMMVFTGSPKSLVIPALKRNGIEHYFEKIITTDEVGCEKTDSDVFVKLLSYIGESAGNVIVYEDSENGTANAKNAGIYTVCIEDDYSKPVVFDRKIKDFRELMK